MRSAIADTFAGRIHVEWDATAPVTPFGQLPFFIDYLKQAGLFDGWVADCPLSFTSPNAPKRRDLLGTVMLSVLSGHRRAHHGATPTFATRPRFYDASSGAPVAWLRPTGCDDKVEVLYWSLWKERWTSTGPFGRTVLPIDDALQFIAHEDHLVRGAKLWAASHFFLVPIRRHGFFASCAAAAHPFRPKPCRA